MGDLMRWPWPGADSLQLPAFFPVLSVMALVYTASAARAARLLPHRRMRIVEVMPGRCLVGLVAVEYRESDLGPYNEVGITIPIAFGARLPVLSALGQGLAKAQTAYVWKLPVTTERARDAGIRIAGFPKELADISFSNEQGRRRCTLAYDGQMALSLLCEAGDDPGDRQLKLRSYTLMDGLPLVSNLIVRQARFRDRVRPAAARLELGRGVVADTLAELNLGDRALASHQCSQAQALLFPPRNPIDD